MTEMQRKKIGFIGVGFMGYGMAKNIVTKGHDLFIIAHKNREPVERLKALGAVELPTIADIAKTCEIIHLCVSDSPTVESVVLGADGLIANGKAEQVIIDCSTSDPVSTLKIAAIAEQKSIKFIDAPLSRTPKEAEAGTLDCMVGADLATFNRIKPILSLWSTNIIHMGAVGAGHTMKLVNNFIALGYGALFAEALALAQKSGISIEKFHQVIGSGRMRSGFYDTFMQYVHDGDHNAHKFTLKNALKDMSYVTSLVNSKGVANPLQSAVRNSYAMAVSDGRGEEYVPNIAEFIAKLNGIK